MDPPFSAKYAIAKNLASMKAAEDLSREERSRIFDRYVKKDEKGMPIKDEEGYFLENPEAYHKEIKALDEQEIEDIRLYPIKLSDIERTPGVTVEMMAEIIDIIQEEATCH